MVIKWGKVKNLREDPRLQENAEKLRLEEKKNLKNDKNDTILRTGSLMLSLALSLPSFSAL